MRLGCISDIHGNRVALDAVIDDMPPVDKLICCGDVIGYNPWPADCLTRIREEADLVVQGNHDREVHTPEKYKQNRSAYEGLKLAQERLSDDQLEWLAGLPEQATTVDGTVRVVHSHPTVLDKYVRPGQFSEMVNHLEDEERCLLLGHTHQQHAVDMGKFDRDELIVNPGSVGQPRDNDPRAAYAVVDTDSWTVELNRVEYDIPRVQEEVSRVGLPKKTGNRLKSGR